MLQFVKFLFWIFYILVNSSVQGIEMQVVKPEKVGMSSEKLLSVDHQMNQHVNNKLLSGGVIMIARQGKVVHHEAYGFTDLVTQSPMQKDSLFFIASMTKAITTTAALILVEENNIALDDPITDYLPELKGLKTALGIKQTPLLRKITIRDLMRHTSGLSFSTAGSFSIEDTRDERLGKIVASFSITHAPGSLWDYGISTDLLGYVVERVSKKTLYDYFEQRIFKPLGMVDTHCWLPPKKRNRLATLYSSYEKGTLEADLSPAEVSLSSKQKFCSGGGGLISTAPDYMKFLMMIEAGGSIDGVTILRESSIQLMRENQLPDNHGWINLNDEPEPREGLHFGLGFSVRDKLSAWDPDSRLGEYGWGGLFSTHYWVSPKDRLIVVTFEQTLPYSSMTARSVKGLIYDALQSEE